MSEYERLSTDYIIISESGAEVPQIDEAVKRWTIERSNLLNIAKICIKSLIDNSLTAGTYVSPYAVAGFYVAPPPTRSITGKSREMSGNVGDSYGG